MYKCACLSRTSDSGKRSCDLLTPVEYGRSIVQLATESLRILYSLFLHLYAMSFIHRYRRECPPVPRCSREVLQKLIELLPPVDEMRKAGSPACEVYETTQLSHICVVDSNPRSRHFGVLFHMVSGSSHYHSFT